MTGVSLAALRGIAGVVGIDGDESVRVRGVCSDSRRVEPGDLFAALVGTKTDGRAFAKKAVELGASAVLCGSPLDVGVPVLRVDDVRARLGAVSHAVFGDPTATLCTFGITGTNGKTTITYLLESVLKAAGRVPALVGTVAMRGPASQTESAMTTPEADTLARFARAQRDAGATDLVMEVSSHALSVGRVVGVRFRVVGFSNLSQDHLDFHGTMEAYGEAKARLFTEYAPEHSVVVIDQPFGEALAKRARGRVLRCATTDRADADLRVVHFESGRDGLEVLLATPQGPLQFHSPLFGRHNLENLLVCVGSALSAGIDIAALKRGLATAIGAPGRMERVQDPRGVLVLVDYAHTPDAIDSALRALRPLTPGRLFVVCGCGGDRDRTKRAPMGAAAVRGADVAVLTSDNPRSEDPQAILDEMEKGAEICGARAEPHAIGGDVRGYCVVRERSAAILCALSAARAGDTVLLAGKGHEDYQIIGTVKQPFDDRLEARRAIATLAGD
jgi:UDP-N-acetylmuramoyl-L-alanyl-D-glutamate--2,6-diaminopimelate ligase